MTFRPDLFAGRVALVTGGTTGIGAGVALALGELGARVVAVGLGAETVRAPEGVDYVALELDVTDDAGVHRIVDGLERIDIVVNCAGVIRRQEEHRIEVFEAVLAVNLTGTMRVCAAARAKLKATGGCIVNTASMLSFFGGGLVPAYSASKGGVAQLTKSLAIAYAADGIRVNAVAPGWIATPLTQALQDDPTRSGPILARTPLKRWGTPEDVARRGLPLQPGVELHDRRGATRRRRLPDRVIPTSASRHVPSDGASAPAGAVTPPSVGTPPRVPFPNRA